jgi:RimJ/RimL family protein N-acetyltransferase
MLGAGEVRIRSHLLFAIMKIEPVFLKGKYVTLEPMGLGHVDELAEVGLEPSIWEFTIDRFTDRSGMQRYVESALADQTRGIALPFVTKLTESNKIVGSTRFGNIGAANRKTEIGWTWIAPAWQRTYVNTEAKLVMLTHAFEVWGCVRVEFKTDATNQRSRNAIRRLGATEEGTLRRHMITDTGRFRDTVYFSILDTEWNRVKAELSEKVRKHE